jgi:hypothetical protein
VKGGSKAKRPSSLGYKVTEPTEHHPAGDAGVKKNNRERNQADVQISKVSWGDGQEIWNMCCGDGI